MSDMNKLEELAKQLDDLLDQDTNDWSREEKAALRQLARTLIAFQRLGRLGFYILITIGILVTNWEKLKGYFAGHGH